MGLDLGGAARSSSETLAWIPVQEVHYQVLGLLGHADGQLQHATLDVVEQFIPEETQSGENAKKPLSDILN